MKKINKHFYLNKEAIEKLEIIKQEKRLKTNNEVIEYLINIYEKKNDNSDMEKVFLKKLSFIDKQSQIILWQSSLLLNFFKVEPMEQASFLYDYIKEAKKDIEKENRIKQLEFLSRS